MIKKLCIFSSDPLQAYVKKGEIKKNYFNPNNFFDEIHIMNPTNEKIDVNSVQIMAGNAKMIVYPIGKMNCFDMFWRKSKVIKLIKKIKPNVIRSYNPLVQGWLAAYCSKKEKIPYWISIHGDYKSEIEKEYLERKEYLRFLKLWLTRNITQNNTVSTASIVSCIHKGLVNYVEKLGAKNIEIIYNKVDFSQFNEKLEPAIKLDKPIILNVGNLRKIKNQECLIRAIENLDVYLLLIGNGEMYDELKHLVKNLKIENKVIFKKFVSHEQIQNYYASATIFAMPLKGEGVTIPTLEALVSGCITIVAEPKREKNEPFDKAIIYVKNTPEGFSNAFTDVLENYSKYEEKIEENKEIIKKIDSKKMENLEKGIYEKLLKDFK
jgi:glycosyltransferase involved in cell wall biosynthesis